MKKVACIIGTRPEVIKCAPVVWQLKKSKTLTPILMTTGQHRELLNQFVQEFDLEPDFEMNIMTENQTPSGVVQAILTKFNQTITHNPVDAVLVQGDTATAYASALAGFFNHLPVGHIEAGLRTYDLEQPWPEEALRQMTDRISSWLFAPTISAKKNLLSEKIPENQIYVTGNTVIDTVKAVSDKLPNFQKTLNSHQIPSHHRYILITGHRRENHGQAFTNIAQALKELATHHQNINFVYPVHPNPNVKGPMESTLKNIANVYLIEPLGYFDFLSLTQGAMCIISDSGGVQEEASVFSKKVILLRNTTERPEGLESGTTIMVGSNPQKIIKAVNQEIEDSNPLQLTKSPYGDGQAAEKIVEILERSLS